MENVMEFQGYSFLEVIGKIHKQYFINIHRDLRISIEFHVFFLTN